MSCDACMKPCERSGLLGVVREPDVHRPATATDQQNKPRRICCSNACMGCTLIAVAAVAGLLWISSKPPMTASGQIAILNAETHRAKELLAEGCESTLVLMRHCEYTDIHGVPVQDDKGNKHCSAVGKQRAEYVADTLFGEGINGTMGRWPLPSDLYAMSTGLQQETERLDFREVETLGPLRRKAAVEIDTRYPEGSEKLFANDYFGKLSKGHLCGNVAVVDWKSKLLPKMALALGCGPEEGCPEKYKSRWFDKVIELKYKYVEERSERRLKRKKKKSRSSKSHLLEGWNVKGKLVKERFFPEEEL